MPKNELQREVSKMFSPSMQRMDVSRVLRGERGEKGDKGDRGPQGPSGRDGKDGKNAVEESGESIVKKLEALPREKRLSFDLLKDTPVFRPSQAPVGASVASRDYALTELTDTPDSFTGHAGDTLIVNATGTGVTFGSPSGNPFGHDEFDAIGGQTVFTLSFSYTPGNKRLQVYVNGLLQRIGAGNSYLETSTTQVTFNSGLVLGDEVTFHLN